LILRIESAEEHDLALQDRVPVGGERLRELVAETVNEETEFTMSCVL
jgi:hypothetical protein